MKFKALLVSVVLLAIGIGPARAESAPITSASVGIQMFGWNWNSLAKECTNVLGPRGIDWILTLPPNDHITGGTWWTHYQPTSYQLNSSAGTPEQFAAMVSACNNAGVKVVTDAVINHMAGRSGTSFSGVTYGDGYFGDLYKPTDFHFGLDKSDPHFCNTDIVFWDEPINRTDCQFPGLPDLATEKPAVRQKIADYLNSQLRLGVYGFRIDAAKHIPAADIAAIKKLLISDAYIVQEIPGDTDLANEYIGNGDVWAWDTAKFADWAFTEPGNANRAAQFDARTKTYPASDKSLTWVSNHDTDHHGGSVAYQNGKLFELSFAWLLAEPYGKPMLYSGYTFFDDAAEAPRDVTGHIKNAVCAGGTGAKTLKGSPADGNYQDYVFTCVQRWTSVAGMIAFRDSVGTAVKSNKFVKSGVYGFSRTGSGYFLMNSNLKTYAAKKVKTGLRPGTYCDLYSGGKSPIKVAGKSCRGKSVVVGKGGLLTTSVSAVSAIAITKSSRLK